MRGPLSAYEALQRTNGTNNDTLYFITDGEGVNAKTLLYVGDNLVSDSSDTLSPTAKAFLESLPTDENQLNDGDIQVYTIKQEEKEVTDPETGETTTVIETKGEWVTKSIDEVLPLSDIAEDILPYVLQSIIGDEPKLDEETGKPLYRQEDGTEGIAVTDEPIYKNGLSASFDTLKEIAGWINDHPNDALEIKDRLTALEEAVGTNQTETQIQPKVDDQGNPVYEQLIDEETGKSQYLDIDPENTNTVLLSELEEGQPIYPAYEENPNGDDPSYVPIVDPETGEQKYWDLDTEPNLIDEDNENAEGKPPAFVQATETVEVEVPNDVEILKTTVGDLAELLGYSNDQNNNKILTTIDNLDTRLDTVESLINNGSNVIALNTKVGNLEDLLLRTVPTNEVQVDEPTSLVQAINVLDNRTRWQDLN